MMQFRQFIAEEMKVGVLFAHDIFIVFDGLQFFKK